MKTVLHGNHLIKLQKTDSGGKIEIHNIRTKDVSTMLVDRDGVFHQQDKKTFTPAIAKKILKLWAKVE